MHDQHADVIIQDEPDPQAIERRLWNLSKAYHLGFVRSRPRFKGTTFYQVSLSGCSDVTADDCQFTILEADGTPLALRDCVVAEARVTAADPLTLDNCLVGKLVLRPPIGEFHLWLPKALRCVVEVQGVGFLAQQAVDAARDLTVFRAKYHFARKRGNPALDALLR